MSEIKKFKVQSSKFKVFSLLFIVFLIACGSPKEKIPDDILSKEKMIEIVTELHVTEASINLNLYNADSLKTIYSKHQVTKSQYDSSFKYYALHPKQLSEIYKGVLNEISKRQAATVNHK